MRFRGQYCLFQGRIELRVKSPTTWILTQEWVQNEDFWTPRHVLNLSKLSAVWFGEWWNDTNGLYQEDSRFVSC